MNECYQILDLFGEKCKTGKEIIKDFQEAIFEIRSDMFEPKKSQVRMLGLKND